ncbi:MAG: Rpn family recombination-promoting nuclease/putative transposase, partial [Albidovulum sp.]|nr:Rpn family recombination-promoting nuclease/putative transposase [Albidovulum sp.]
MVSNPQRAGILLVEKLPESLARLVDTDEPPERVEGSFVDGEGRSTRSDALFRVRLRTGKSALVYALLEHKSH